MKKYSIINIREVLYSVGDMAKVQHLFEDYGGWNRVGMYKTTQEVIAYWGLDNKTAASEILIQSNGYHSGQLRLIQFANVEQEYIRSSQQPWDTGGIMDINLRVHEVRETFDHLRELGFHGLSDPLLQKLGPFKLYDILMRGYDDTIIAFTHRLEPPMELPATINLPTHVYKTSITVPSLEDAMEFYVDKLGCKVLTEYQFKKDKPQENMFGLPHNLADKVTCKAAILSIHGGTDVDFQIVEFDGITGKDHSSRAMPPNRGFVLYRVELKGIEEYAKHLSKKEIELYRPITKLEIEPYGTVLCMSIRSDNGVIWEFFEKNQI